MAYITQTDLIDAYSTALITQWSNLDNSSVSINTTRVADALAFAQGYIDAHLRNSLYVVPLSFVDTYAEEYLKKLATTLAAWNLYSPRSMTEGKGLKLQESKDETDAELTMIRVGDVRPNFGKNSNVMDQPFVVR